MPLIVKDYTWTQTESVVYIQVPLKGAKAGNVDILCTDEYIKIHFPPFLFEAFLFEPIDEDKSSAKLGNGMAFLILPKKTKTLWKQLMLNTDDKQKMKEIREQALLKYQEKVDTQSKAKAAKKDVEKKYALETMMKLEQQERDAIQKVKDDEREKATAELDAWKLKQRQRADNGDERQVEPGRTNNMNEPKTNQQTRQPAGGGKAKLDPRSSTGQRQKKTQVDLPPPRSMGSIQITFTPRVFPTALRESQVPEEDEWLQKQAEARRAINANLAELKDLNPEERNPDWLKDKGDKCFATGNFLGALNAYNLAIKLNNKLPALYSNRAACHLKLRHLHKAIEDSSQALNLLTPPVTDNASARARAHVRRGTAFCELELYTEGLQDYQTAAKIQGQNEALQGDIHRIRQIIQGSATGPDE